MGAGGRGRCDFWGRSEREFMETESCFRLRKPVLAVVSAPSGAGKSTLCGMLLREFSGFVYSVSCTTRAPRGAERDGVDYHFITEEEFQNKVRAGEFLECAGVHGFHYGTLRSAVERALCAGKSVLMDIDVKGAAQVREKVFALPPDSAVRSGFVDVFINVPSLDDLRNRLYKRGEDSAETIEKRLENAAGEIAESRSFGNVVVNDDLRLAYARFREIIVAAGKGAEPV